ncbi:protein of unknown function [Pseudomonas inefficax]|uniref:Uncharacterized protein n=1 Tax=Pseudomonas inefficax TaxID=2078786 RepID=A0AAQ1P591_9PSED|nr:protein of unknown function [Pseudomonas inefficax]
MSESPNSWGFAGDVGGLSTELSTGTVDCPERLL